MRRFFPGLIINSSLTEGNSNLLIESNSINYPSYSLYDNFLDSSVDSNQKDFSKVKLLLYVSSLLFDNASPNEPKEIVNDLTSLKSFAAKFLNLVQ